MTREALGELVRDTWIGWARRQPKPKPSWLVPWGSLAAPDREVDMLIGEAVAKAERERIRVAAEGLRVNLVRPGNGPAQDETFTVVPWETLTQLLDGGKLWMRQHLPRVITGAPAN